MHYTNALHHCLCTIDLMKCRDRWIYSSLCSTHNNKIHIVPYCFQKDKVRKIFQITWILPKKWWNCSLVSWWCCRLVITRASRLPFHGENNMLALVLSWAVSKDQATPPPPQKKKKKIIYTDLKGRLKHSGMQFLLLQKHNTKKRKGKVELLHVF